MNGPQRGAINYEKFKAFVVLRDTEGDWVDYTRGFSLNKSEIARELGFHNSIWGDNPDIRDLYIATECRLQNDGILKKKTISTITGNISATQEDKLSKHKQRINFLEQQNQALLAVNHELKEKLERYGMIDEYLLETGRLPR